MTIKVEDVRSYHVFRNLSPASLAEVQARLAERTIARNRPVFHEGDLCDSLFLLRRGRVKVFKTSADRRTLALAILHPGDHFDITPIFDGGLHMLSAQALDDVSVHIISKADLLELTVRRPDLAAALLTAVLGALRRLTGVVAQVSHQSVVCRLASFILEQVPTSGPVRLDITQRELAELLGTWREVVSRALGRLEKDGILHVSYPLIDILDRERLQSLAP